VIEATVFRAVGGRLPGWESLLPAELLRVPEELARVDALLDDPAFFAPFAPYFHPVLGRPSHADPVLPAADVLQVPVPAGL
jgi:transposase, IS5 family